jgi:hypothetical protein
MKFLLCLTLVAGAVTARAATYSSTGAFDSGMARSQNGSAAHCGVLGSWLRTPMQSANYLNQPGLPMPPAVLPEASLPVPWLRIASVGSDVRVSWPAWAGAYLLLESTDLADSSSWTKVSDPYQTNATEIHIVVPPSGQRYYRLIFSP